MTGARCLKTKQWSHFQGLKGPRRSFLDISSTPEHYLQRVIYLHSQHFTLSARQIPCDLMDIRLSFPTLSYAAVKRRFGVSHAHCDNNHFISGNNKPDVTEPSSNLCKRKYAVNTFADFFNVHPISHDCLYHVKSITIFSDPYSLTDRFNPSGQTYCFNLQGTRRCHLSTTLHGVTSRKTVIFIFTAARTSNLTRI